MMFHRSLVFADIWSWTKVLDKLKFWPDDGAKGVIQVHPVGNMNVKNTFHANPSNSYLDISLKS